MKKQLLLSAIAIASLLLLAIMPRNREWLQQRIAVYYRDLPAEIKHPGIEHRKVSRYGKDYVYSRLVQQVLQKKAAGSSALVLMPGSGYFSHHGIEYNVPEPAVFYYLAGIKTISAGSPAASKANWFVGAGKGGLVIDRFQTDEQLADSIRSFYLQLP